MSEDSPSLADLQQKHATPGEWHHRLEPLIGIWDTFTTLWVSADRRPIESDGSVEKTWTLGGRFVREDLAGVSPDGNPHLGLGFIGYDTVQKRYQGVWMNSGMSAMSHFTGQMNPTTHTITFTGEETDPAGGPPRRFRSVLTIVSPRRHQLLQSFLTEEGRWQPAFEIVYDRVDSEG